MSSAAALLMAVTASILAAEGAALVPVQVCSTMRIAREANTQHAAFAAHYYAASDAPLLNVTTKYVGQYQPGARTTANDLARSFILNGSATCDIVIGTGSSLISPVFSPLVDVLWIDYSATSSSLSDKVLYPYFNRVNPSTVQGTAAMAALAIQFGWTEVNTLAYNDDIGATTIAGFNTNFVKLGGRPGPLSFSLDPSSTRADFTRMLDALAVADSQIVFLSSTLEQNPLVWLLEIDPSYNSKYSHLTFLFAQASCGNPSHPWARIKGSFCVDYAVDDVRVAEFVSAYVRRDAAADEAAFRALGWPPFGPEEVNGSGTFAIYAADATRYALRTYNAYVALNNGSRMPRGSLDLPKFAREQGGVMENALSGRVDLDADGDRVFTQTVILNAIPGNLTAVVANASDAELFLPSSTVLYFAKVGAATSATAPTWRRAVDANSKSLSDEAVIAIAVCAVLAAMVLILLLLLGVCTRPRDDAACAPADDKRPFTIVFTDIQASTLLWASCPEVMGLAIDQHHALIRALVAKYNGYEVKTIGDAFMVAFVDVLDAVHFATALQVDFHSADWDTDAFDAVYREIDAGIREDMSLAASTSASTRSGAFMSQDDLDPEEYRRRWNGLRVRVGMNTGMGTIKLDATTQRYDYYGTVVNVAARVEGLATGGQVIVSESTHNALLDASPPVLLGSTASASATSSSATFVASSLGAHAVRGITEPITVFELSLVAALRERRFPPIGRSLSGDVDNDIPGDFDLAAVGADPSGATDTDDATAAGFGVRRKSDNPFPMSPDQTTAPSPSCPPIRGDTDQSLKSGADLSAPPELNVNASMIHGGNAATTESSSSFTGGAPNSSAEATRVRYLKRMADLLAIRHGRDYSESVSEHHRYLNSLLSALPAKKRLELLRTIAAAWRVGGDSVVAARSSQGNLFEFAKKGPDHEADAMMLAFDIAAKVETAHGVRHTTVKAAVNAARVRNRRRSSVSMMPMMRSIGGPSFEVNDDEDAKSGGDGPTLQKQPPAPPPQQQQQLSPLRSILLRRQPSEYSDDGSASGRPAMVQVGAAEVDAEAVVEDQE